MSLVFLYYLLFNFLFSLCYAGLSGLYVDNGADQTVIQHFMTEKEKQFISEDLLNLLGLPKRPRVRRDESKNHIHNSAPKYLMSVYNALSDSSSPFNLTETDLNNIDESDVIVTIVGHNIKTKIEEKRKSFWLDLSGISVQEVMLGGELRLYKKAVRSQPETVYRLSVYARPQTDNGSEEPTLVDSVRVQSSFEGWLRFNMSSVLTSWIVFPNSNKGIYVVMHSTDSPGEEIELSEGGIVVEDARKEHESFLVVYLRTSRTVHVGRVRRETKHRAKKAHSSYPSGNPLIEPSSQINRNCQIQTLYVSFKDLKWHDWIIAPEGYGAFYCSGECNFPLNAHMNATNHAIVQTLVHLNNPVQVPRPCCAPTKLTPISVLYFQDDSSNVILKKYKNMVVKSCGCH